MARITLNIQGNAGGEMSVVTTLDETNGDRLMAYLERTYGTKVTAGVISRRTPQEMVELYWSDFIRHTASQVERSEKQLASEAAQAAVLPFVAG